jgi:hypothetical protein
MKKLIILSVLLTSIIFVHSVFANFNVTVKENTPMEIKVENSNGVVNVQIVFTEKVSKDYAKNILEFIMIKSIKFRNKNEDILGSVWYVPNADDYQQEQMTFSNGISFYIIKKGTKECIPYNY